MLVWCVSGCFNGPNSGGTQTYRNETEIPERNIKIIGKHIQVPKWLMDHANAFLILVLFHNNVFMMSILEFKRTF